MSLVAILQGELTYTPNVGSGAWQERNAKTVVIRSNWSMFLFYVVLQAVETDGACREIRKKCPNSVILRELDQIAQSMK